MKRMFLFDVLVLSSIFFFLTAAPAQAYFDLGTGAYLWQIIFGFAAAFWLSLKGNFLMWRKPKKSDAAGKAAGKDKPEVTETGTTAGEQPGNTKSEESA